MEESNLDVIAEDDVITSLVDLTSLKVGIRALDVTGITEFIKLGVDLQSNFTEPSKYRTALHDLILSYCARHPVQKSPYTLGKFTEILNVLIDTGLDIHDNDVTGQCALHMVASFPGSKDVLEVLLQLGAKVNKIDRTHQSALHKAAHCGGRYECLALVQAGADIHLMDSRGYSAIHVAAKRRHSTDTIEQLLQLGANINHQEVRQKSSGSTPIHIACRSENISNVACLLKNGAKTHLQDGAGQTCVHLAVAHDMTGQIVTSLLKARAPANIPDTLLGDTPLHKAVQHQMNHNILLLLKSGANLLMTNASGETPLHKAAVHCKDISIWKALLKGISIITLKAHNNNGLTAKDKAQRCKNNVGLCMLRQYEDALETSGDAKSPRLPHRGVHARDIAVSPNIMRRNVSA